MNEFSVMQNISINFYFSQYNGLCSEFQCLDWFEYQFDEALKRFFIIPKTVHTKILPDQLETQFIYLNFGKINGGNTALKNLYLH